jgi:hypothetical protein
MRFISKSSNYNLILKAGLPGNHLLGTAPQSAISVRFQQGVADVNDERIIDMLKLHPDFGRDFVSSEDIMPGIKDPFASLRKDVAPVHVVTEMAYGHPSKKTIGAPQAEMPPVLQEMIAAQATALAQKMFEGMVEKFEARLASAAQAKTPDPVTVEVPPQITQVSDVTLTPFDISDEGATDESEEDSQPAARGKKSKAAPVEA